MISIRRKQLCLSRLHILYMKGLFYHWAIFLTREDVYLLDSASCAWIRLHVSCFELGEAGFQKERERTLQLLLLVSSSLSLSVAVNQTGVGGFFWLAHLWAAWAWSVIRRGGLRAAARSPGAGSLSRGWCRVRVWQPVSTVCMHECVRCEGAALTFGEKYGAAVCER